MIILTKFRALFFSCLLTGIISLLLSCNRGASASEEVAKVKTPVTIGPVTFKSVTSTVDLPAVTMFMNKNIIRATTAGMIENISIKPGDYIAADQLLFTIRTRESMALYNKNGSDTSLTFKGVINITSHREGVISSIAYQKGDFVLEGDEMAVVSEQNSLVFILDVPF